MKLDAGCGVDDWMLDVVGELMSPLGGLGVRSDCNAGNLNHQTLLVQYQLTRPNKVD